MSMSIQDSTPSDLTRDLTSNFTYTLPPAINTYETRAIPYLPPEIIENIVELLLLGIRNCRDSTFHVTCETYKHENEYTLLNLFIVFPYLLHQIKSKICNHDIPLHIYNFVYMKIDNVFELLVTLVENLKDIYSLDLWLNFITCEHSPFYNTVEGIKFVNYILNKYSNHQAKKITNYLLCSILEHNIITKRLDNIIFNKIVSAFQNTKKLNISLLSNKEKQVLLLYTRATFRSTYPAFELTDYIVTVLKLRSTKIIDILAENMYLTNLHTLNRTKITNFILDNYTFDNYLLGLTIQYYLTAVLNTTYTKYKADELKNIYLSIIKDILAEAVIKRNCYVINLILSMKESTKTNILHIISSDYLYNTKEHFEYIFMYITDKYTFNVTDFSLFDWEHTHVNFKKNVLFYTQIEPSIDVMSNTQNKHNTVKALLYKIYNYMVYNYNRLNMELIYNKSYILKDIDTDTDTDTIQTTLFTYSNSILLNLELLNIKHDIEKLYKYISKFYYFINKCAYIIKQIDKYNKPIQYDDNKRKSKKIYIRRIMFLYNIFNFVIKYKLYHDKQFNTRLNKTSIRLIDELNTIKYNTITTHSISINIDKNTTQNRQIVEHSIKLREILTKMTEFSSRYLNIHIEPIVEGEVG